MSDKLNSNRSKMADITGELRDTAAKWHFEENFYVLALLAFTAINQLRFYSKSFALLGVLIAFASIVFNDGGFLYWGRRYRLSSKDASQAKIAKAMRWACMANIGLISLLDMLLHSGQGYIPLDTQVEMFGGWFATVEQIAGAIGMFSIIGILIANLAAKTAFDDADVEVKQKITERQVGFEEQKRQIAMMQARNRLQSNLSADAIETLQDNYEDLRVAAAANMGKMLMPDIISEWEGKMTGRKVIEAKAGDIPAQRQQQFNQRPMERQFAEDMAVPEKDTVLITPVPNQQKEQHREFKQQDRPNFTKGQRG